MKQKKKDLIVFSIYAIITFILIFFHEAWRDEAQAWLLARELNVGELISQMKYEGHFLIWYLILMPFAKLGFPYITTNIISWIITPISAWLVLKYAPFKAYKKYLFIFSFPMLYLFPIISRSYCLIPLAITLIAIFYEKRKTKPIRYVLAIALLANTHVIMLGMVGLLLMEFYAEQYKERKNNLEKENKKIVVSCILVAILLLLSCMPLMGCLTTNKDVGNNAPLATKILDMIIIEPVIMILNIYSTLMGSRTLLIVIFLLIIIYAFEEIVHNKKELMKILIILLWQYMIYAFIYSTSNQRAATGVFVIFFYRWIRAYKPQKETNKLDKRITEIVLVALLVINIMGGILYIKEEITNNCSSAYQVGQYINENIDDNSIMITGNQVEFSSAIIPYVEKNVKFYYIQEERFFTYAEWSESNRQELNEDFMEKVTNKFGNKQKLYYIYATEKVSSLIVSNFPKLENKPQIFDIGTTIGCHSGPGTVAVFFWGKEREL